MSQFFSIKSAWPWLALFMLAFLCFFGRLWVNQFMEIKIHELTYAAEQMGIKIKDSRLLKFPPSLQFNSIEIPVREKKLLLFRPRLNLGFLPLRVQFSAKILGGTVDAEAYLDFGNPPQISKLTFDINNLLLTELVTLTKLSEFLVIENGYLNGGGTINLKYKNHLPDWNTAEGTASFKLKDGSLALKLPLLKKDKITNILGNAHMRLQGAILEIDSCRITALPIFFEAVGKLTTWFSPKKAQLKLNTELRIPADLINSSFIPERTKSIIQQKGVVRTKIAGHLFSPKIYLEN